MVALSTLLETHNLERWFGGLCAVQRVNFRLDRGATHGIIGPNGAGKTTFVNMISGRIPPTAGSVLFEGQDITDLPAHQRVSLGIAYTFQLVSIFRRLTLYENVALALQRRLTRQWRDVIALNPPTLTTQVEDALAEVGLAMRPEQPAGSLAYGHQRLLEIAMVLALKPDLLILDEPTQGLAPEEVAGLIALIKRMAGRLSILLIEHNTEVVLSVSTRITVMDTGQVVAEGTPQEIEGNTHVQRIYLGQ